MADFLNLPNLVLALQEDLAVYRKCVNLARMTEMCLLCFTQQVLYGRIKDIQPAGKYAKGWQDHAALILNKTPPAYTPELERKPSFGMIMPAYQTRNFSLICPDLMTEIKAASCCVWQYFARQKFRQLTVVISVIQINALSFANFLSCF